VGVFPFVIILVAITTFGRIVTRLLPSGAARAVPPQLPPGQLEDLRESIDQLSGRVVRLEDERDFYKELLDAPGRQRKLSPPDGNKPPPSAE